ncbi:Enoyl-CoA hydratase ACTT3 [Colletotrichum shisoi]|uniref:Enoyl-CoA hydratase ACTT3 n=1 Tax=Colletotrichum shisoi TaxID=2078593 RepID=A0A5Q4BS83_9PEZI|nr:Enoyl-CoA hydratase ACTT3 [Colletotrichum shisoi]
MNESAASLPASSAALEYDGLAVSHVPPSSSAVTKVMVITLNRPHKYNAVTLGMLDGLEALFNTIGEDPRVRAVVLTGEGKASSAGVDLDVGFTGMPSLKESEQTMRDFRDWGGRVALAITNCKKPTVFAVNGAAVGVGLTMTLPATIRVAWEGARCGLPFSRRGIVLESCSAFFLPRLIGLSRGSHIVVATGDVYAVTDPLTSLVSTKLMRDMLLRFPASPEGAHVLDSRIFLQLAGTADNVEGLASFLEKRAPNFTDTASP